MYPILAGYINFMATDGGGGVDGWTTATIVSAIWSLVQIPKTWILFFRYFSFCYYFS